MRVLRGTVRVLNWSPFPPQPWPERMFGMLWKVTLVIALMLSLPSWLGHPVPFGEVGTEEDWGTVEKEPNWNADLDLGDGVCLDIAAGRRYDCSGLE